MSGEQDNQAPLLEWSTILSYVLVPRTSARHRTNVFYMHTRHEKTNGKQDTNTYYLVDESEDHHISLNPCRGLAHGAADMFLPPPHTRMYLLPEKQTKGGRVSPWLERGGINVGGLSKFCRTYVCFATPRAWRLVGFSREPLLVFAENTEYTFLKKKQKSKGKVDQKLFLPRCRPISFRNKRKRVCWHEGDKS